MHSTPQKKLQSAPISLHKVRQLFGKTERISGSQFLRREIAQRMQERLPLINITPKSVVDLGCGEGQDILTLQQYFPEAEVIGVDGALPMLMQAVEQIDGTQHVLHKLFNRLFHGAGAKSSGKFICANYAQLPVKPDSFDMIWSNLALHWHPMPDVVFQEWSRILSNEGLLMFTCFGPDTCKELREVFTQLGFGQQVLPFVDMHDLGDMLGQHGFAAPVMDMEQLTLTYSTPQDVLNDVRALGGNPLETAAAGLLGRQTYQDLCQLLDKKRRKQDGKIGLTIEVIYGHAFKSAPQQKASGEQIIQWNLPRADKK